MAIAFGLVGFLPVANWIAGGHTAPWYGAVLQTWLSGTAIVAGVVVVLVILTRGRVLEIAPRIAQASTRWFSGKPLLAALFIAVAATAAYAITAQLVFDGKALFIDEIVQLYQARLFAAGRLTDPVGPYPEFFGALNVVSLGDEQFGQFPPGGPAHLALGVLLGAPWLITPLIGGCVVFTFAQLVRRFEPDPGVAFGAVLLLAFSPFMLFMSASHMNHVPTLFWILLAWLAWSRLTRDQTAKLRSAFVFGFAAAAAATIRPVDAVAMTAPAFALWSLRARQHRATSLALMCLGAALPAALLLAFNSATTGSPFLFGYEAIWGKTHSLGFHDSPWGTPHSPARGLELLNLYALRLQSYLFETPLPSLLPVVVSLALANRLTKLDQAMLWSVALLSLAYFAYWHDGFYLGPRFFFLFLPAMAVLTARAPRLLGEATANANVRRYAFLTVVVSTLIGLATGLPQRARLYAHTLSNSRYGITAQVESLGTHAALVFVRESWGSRVLARLWGRDIQRPDAEFLYRSIDTCILDSAVTTLERENTTGSAARVRLWPLLRDSMAVRSSTLSPDHTERVSSRPYSSHCLQQVAEDRRGTALYPIVLAEPKGTNVFARDLGERNSVLVQRYPDRRAYVLLPRTPGDSLYALVPFAPAPATRVSVRAASAR